jgi:hypothetical protein
VVGTAEPGQSDGMPAIPATSQEDSRARRDAALDALARASRCRVPPADALAWCGAVGRLLAAEKAPTVLEHTTLAFLARSLRGAVPSGELRALLACSWLRLVGRPPRSNELEDRLPHRVLRRATREERLLHAASFCSAPVPRRWSLRAVAPDVVLEARDGIALTLASGIAFLVADTALLCMAALGYLIATFAEYAMHRWAGHEGNRLMRPVLHRLSGAGRMVGEFLAAVHLGHFTVHHARTSNRHYTAQFGPRPPFDRTTVDAELDALGAAGRYVKASDYGMTLSHSGVAAGLLATLPLHLLLIWALSPGPAGIAALLAPSLLYVAASKSLHRYLHRRPEHAMASAGPLMRLLLRTRYAEWVSRCHWIHHKGGGGNYNLVPGADLLLRKYRRPDLRMVFRMRADRILGAWWKPP